MTNRKYIVIPLKESNFSLTSTSSPENHTHTHTHTYIYIYIYIHTFDIKLSTVSSRVLDARMAEQQY